MDHLPLARAGDGPLAGFNIIELAGIGPCPFAGQLLADMGASVILIDRPGFNLPFIEKRGKRSMVLDLRKPGAAEIVLKLAETSDALIEGFRPGVAERLGVGPGDCQVRNAALVYGRMTGWGQSGPWSKMAGHDINYLSITGALQAIGPAGGPPSLPLNLVGDYGGGSLFLAMGVLAGLLKAGKTGQGDIIDAAIIDGVGAMMGIIHSLASVNQWTNQRGANMLDGGAPYYRCYQTADDRFMAVGAIEPQFFNLMLSTLRVDPSAYGNQNDRTKWPQQHQLLEAIFATKSQAEWSALFDQQDACVTPVLDYQEAVQHPQISARQSHQKVGATIHPARAPRFGSHQAHDMPMLAEKGGDGNDILNDLGFTDTQIKTLVSDGVVHL